MCIRDSNKMERLLGVKAIFGDDSRLARHLEAALDAHVLKLSLIHISEPTRPY